MSNPDIPWIDMPWGDDTAAPDLFKMIDGVAAATGGLYYYTMGLPKPLRAVAAAGLSSMVSRLVVAMLPEDYKGYNNRQKREVLVALMGALGGWAMRQSPTKTAIHAVSIQLIAGELNMMIQALTTTTPTS